MTNQTKIALCVDWSGCPEYKGLSLKEAAVKTMKAYWAYWADDNFLKFVERTRAETAKSPRADGLPIIVSEERAFLEIRPMHSTSPDEKPLIIPTVEDMPEKSVPCPCGEDGCWLVYYPAEFSKEASACTSVNNAAHG